jgi:adenosylhomocysteine nucleosidase
MIAITFAVPAESSRLVGLLREKKRASSSGGKIVYGKIENQSVAILHTGVGRKSCQLKIDNFLRTEQPRRLISSGFAGATGGHFQVGDLIVAENFSDRELVSEAQQILMNGNVRTAKLFTSTTIVDSIDARNEIARTNGADAVDMETEVIAQACSVRGVPMLSLRVISDSLREPFPAPPSILFDLERQRTNAAKLSLYLINHPGALFVLFRFARQITQARRILTDAIVDLLRRVDS